MSADVPPQQISKAAAAAASTSSASSDDKPRPKIYGEDDHNKTFTSADELWEQQLQGDVNDPKKGWYGKAISYWAGVPPTMDGVLGGLSEVHAGDVKESKKFIESVATVQRVRALDCGAGIGRLTKTLLAPLGFQKVDLMEPLPHMLDQARKELEPLSIAGEFMLVSMQQAKLQPSTYDLIVIQWAAIYLTDDDFVTFLKMCGAALRPGGVVFFKENCTGENTGKFVVDNDDSSLTRSDVHYKMIFERAGMACVKEEYQQSWPKNLFPVKMYALTPNNKQQAPQQDAAA